MVKYQEFYKDLSAQHNDLQLLELFLVQIYKVIIMKEGKLNAGLA